ncbi:MAG: hypothetical protein BWY83_02884 [bacterium ADurb.Bin478]|nr:MAG: hypothetical protein BWY83_02884 [bacterium ADurb.Bin478]
MAFICALASICLRAMSRKRFPRDSITARTATAWISWVTMPTMVLLMAFCAPITSLFSRLISSPTWVLVKKRSDMRCKPAYSAMRRS